MPSAAVHKSTPILFLTGLLILPHVARSQERYSSRPNFKDPDAIAAVESGRSAVANAAWWGFNPEDGTGAIQAAIDSGADTVIIPYMGMDWIVRPHFANDEIIVRPAWSSPRSRAFRGDRDSLLWHRDSRRSLGMCGADASWTATPHKFGHEAPSH
jgi:hypothetical protein